jgi:hypothetical protein
MLWHYTDAAGAFGIITSHVLWFGDARFLNDRTEGIYPAELVTDILNDRRLRAPDPYDLLPTARLQWAANRVQSGLYVCSFSEVKDSLSQWQRYGAGGRGYSIGFHPQELDVRLGRAVRRLRMVYDRKRLHGILRQALKHELARYTADLQIGAATYGGASASTAAGFVAYALEQHALALKHPNFADELEWRYILRAVELLGQEPRWPVLFKLRDAYLKPFVELPRPTLEGVSRSPLPIAQVVCGPSLDQSLAVASLEHLLGETGHENTTVESSQLMQVWREH